MRKTILTAAFAVALAASAQTELPKAFSFTVVPDGETPVTITSITTDAEGENLMSIDWGDGVLTEPVQIEDYWTTMNPRAYTAVPKGETITVYANPNAVHYIDGSWATGNLKWTSIDVAACVELKNLNLASNALTAIDVTANPDITSLNVSNNDVVGAVDLSANAAITTLNFSNSATLGTNNIDGSDFSVLVNATTINVAYNKLTAINVAGLSKLKTLNITSCGLPALDLTGCSALVTLNGNENALKTIDLSGCGVKAPKFWLNNNKLTSVKVGTGYTGASALHVTENCLTFSTLPEILSDGFFKTYNYTPQADIKIEAVSGNVDLTDYMPTIGGNATVAAWTDGDKALEEGVDYTVEGCVYTFLVPCKAAKVALTNASFPALTLNSNEVSIELTGIASVLGAEGNAAYYSISGQRVATPAPGLYIRVIDGKATKVIVR